MEGIFNYEIGQENEVQPYHTSNESNRDVIHALGFGKPDLDLGVHILELHTREEQRMAETIINPQGQDIRSGPEVVTEFVRKITADKNLEKDTVAAIEGLHRAGKLTTNNLLKSLESARGIAGHGSLTKA